MTASAYHSRSVARAQKHTQKITGHQQANNGGRITFSFDSQAQKGCKESVC